MRHCHPPLACTRALSLSFSPPLSPTRISFSSVLYPAVSLIYADMRFRFFADMTMLSLLQGRNQYLEGSIPSDIGNLAGLKHLCLYINRLSGEIPPSLGNATLLLVLDLSENNLTGSLPATIGQCTQLSELRANQNELHGAIPSTLGDCLQLKKLSLRDNKLSGRSVNMGGTRGTQHASPVATHQRPLEAGY